MISTKCKSSSIYQQVETLSRNNKQSKKDSEAEVIAEVTAFKSPKGLTPILYPTELDLHKIVALLNYLAW